MRPRCCYFRSQLSARQKFLRRMDSVHPRPRCPVPLYPPALLASLLFSPPPDCLMALVPAALFSPHLARNRSLRACRGFSFSRSSPAASTVPYLLTKLPVADRTQIAVLPPVSFLGLARTVWLNSADHFAVRMSKAALFALAVAFLIALLAYALSFRRSFLRIPEMADAVRCPVSIIPFPTRASSQIGFLRGASQRACLSLCGANASAQRCHLQILLGLPLWDWFFPHKLSLPRPIFALW